MVSQYRVEQVDEVLSRFTRFARSRIDVRALALVGSWAYGSPRDDSDVDIVLLSNSPSLYVDRDDWLADVGGERILRTARWGVVTERRYLAPGGLEVELGISAPAWASTSPIDPGTRRVLTDGLQVLWDPDRLLESLIARLGPQGHDQQR